jgi:hypothetical protein
MVLGFDGVIANGLEKVARNLETVVGFLFAVCVGPASVAERAANPVIGVEDIVVRNPDVPENVPRRVGRSAPGLQSDPSPPSRC